MNLDARQCEYSLKFNRMWKGSACLLSKAVESYTGMGKQRGLHSSLAPPLGTFCHLYYGSILPHQRILQLSWMLFGLKIFHLRQERQVQNRFLTSVPIQDFRISKDGKLEAQSLWIVCLH